MNEYREPTRDEFDNLLDKLKFFAYDTVGFGIELSDDEISWLLKGLREMYRAVQEGS